MSQSIFFFKTLAHFWMLAYFLHNLFLDKPCVSLIFKLVNFVTLLNATCDKPYSLSLSAKLTTTFIDMVIPYAFYIAQI